ncbi:P-loop containing nucleoside triphosphate hydrolase protein [Penicillium macrosclerotiorum]|uniref:P-loop containing nucleoside triphosphate hydrolase protein n=1 Tax=Penicillium macrosclerotiorum TaxID=303699 RepID=UPI0025482B03|nr:P-loop containing nucleoside triphosphate hydrolase protein [Penicillium macrosclerotiorum]KAJ5678957.1 P-loop containing nucleoside triphosphate hydrolase protein [Penicillium macrosclerotiorum]
MIAPSRYATVASGQTPDPPQASTISKLLTVMLNPALPCSVADQDVFGPSVNTSCHHGFDFTLLFEETILTLLPIILFYPVAALRIWNLHYASEKVNRSWLYATKETALLLHIALQLILLVFWCQSSTPTTRATIPTAIANIVSLLLVLYLSHLEHLRSLRPSTTNCLFLGLTTLLDLARLRTLYFIPDNQLISILFAVSWIGKVIVLVLESTEKRSLLKKEYTESSLEATSSIFNRGIFWWLNGLLWKGSRTVLTVESLPVLDEDIQASSNPEELFEKWKKANKYRPNALLWTFVAHYKWQFLVGVLPRVAYTAFTFAQPFLVQRVLEFMTESEHVNSENYAHGLIAAYAIVYVGIAISYAIYEHKTCRLITMVRGSLVTMIFDKTLRMSTSAASDATAITLMSTDIERIGSGLREMHELYSNFSEVILALWLLARLLNIATVASTIIVVVCLIAGIPLSIASGNAQGIWLEAVEERVAVTSKVLGVMKSIKMTGLTEVIANSLRDLRSGEIQASFLFRLYSVLVVTFSYASSALAPVFGFGVYIILARANDSGTLTNGLAFSALTLFSLLDQPMVSFVYGSEDIMAVVNCFQRIQKHLLETERDDCRLTHDLQKPQLIEVDHMDKHRSHDSFSIIARNLSASWSVDDEPVLKGLTFDISVGETTMIIGPVGSGKSTLLRVLLGEIPESSGMISTTYQNAAYCSQSPWITFGSIQQNIVGASQWDQKWYDRVIQACALQADLLQLPSGDQTKVGVRGSRLSGGQQMRVALARALYSREPVLILDDALTGLDRETERCILQDVFASEGLVKEVGQTVILATNSAHHLPYADFVIALDEGGKIIEQGLYTELVTAQGYVSAIASKSSTAATTRAPELALDDETLKGLNLDNDNTDNASRRTGDLLVYWYYFQNIGWPLLFLFFGCSVLFVAGMIFPQIWLQWWTRANEEQPNENVGYWLGGYGALGLLTLLAAFLSEWVLGMMIVPKTARQFHNILLDTTMSATTSFLTSTDIGATTNRFSQDLELIDEELHTAFESTILAVLFCIVEGFLVFVGSSYATVAVIPFTIIAVYYVAQYYVRTSRQIRLLDIEAKAPLFSHFLEALSGLSSIRAYGWTENYQYQSKLALDTSQKPFYMMYCIQRWLNLVLDLIVAGIAVVVISIALSLRGTSSLNLLGIALFNIVNFSGTLQMLVNRWTGLETSIGAVSRIRSYVQSAQTEDLEHETEAIPTFWPEKGNIEIAGLTASYDSSPEPVLQDITLGICAGEKVALCGRTGSGKSSLISTFLRVINLDSGTIHIDGVDLSRISRSHVRSRLNTIPQQAFFLHGTVRLNANPLGDMPDETIIEALNEVKLWSYLESKGGLDAEMSEDILSHGQQQLFCLARALCKPSRILIMDEATSSVDSETEDLMQEIIRTRFKEQTVIAIAHKLDTILDYDKIAFMDRGRIVEFDTPRALLSQETSAFKTLFDSFRHRPE